LLSVKAKSTQKIKLMGIINANFEVIYLLLIRYSAFIIYERKNRVQWDRISASFYRFLYKKKTISEDKFLIASNTPTKLERVIKYHQIKPTLKYV
jgi:hypothetical protein